MSKRFLSSLMMLSLLCASGSFAAESKSLYDRLGGKRAIAAVVDDFVNAAAKNPKVNFTRDGKFKSMDVPFLKGQLTDFISAVTGGPVKYVGKDMKTAHAGMKIKASEFDALAGDLLTSLEKFNVPEGEKNELMKLVASTKGIIVEVDDAKAAMAAPTNAVPVKATPAKAAAPAAKPAAPAAKSSEPAAKPTNAASGGTAETQVKVESMGVSSLYSRLGGEPAVKAVIDHFVNLAAADKKVNFLRDGKFKNLDVAHLKKQLVNFVTFATGGPNNYNGLDMKSAHEGMKIKASEFDAIAADLLTTLKKLKVPAKETNELMAIVGSTKKDIVEVP